MQSFLEEQLIADCVGEIKHKGYNPLCYFENDEEMWISFLGLNLPNGEIIANLNDREYKKMVEIFNNLNINKINSKIYKGVMGE